MACFLRQEDCFFFWRLGATISVVGLKFGTRKVWMSTYMRVGTSEEERGGFTNATSLLSAD